MNPCAESFKELSRRVDFTSKARYNAARRLNLHSKLSQWTLATLALGQITISLIPSLGLPSNYPAQYINFGSIFFGALVLTYSLLIGMSNFSTRSYVMHDCGIALGDLARKLHLLSRCPDATSEQYERCSEKYYAILAKCENHAHQDYLNTNANNLDEELSCHNKIDLELLVKYKRAYASRLSSASFKAIEFMHYLITMGVMFVWIFKMVYPINFNAD